MMAAMRWVLRIFVKAAAALSVFLLVASIILWVRSYFVGNLIRHIGEGGGHRTKAGGFVTLENGSPTEIERHRTTLRRRLLRSLGIRMSRGQRLVPAKEN